MPPPEARAAELLAAFGLEEAAARQAKAYSGGMRRRLDLAASLIVRAEVYFLDEPTTGLDPASRAQVCDQIIRALAAGGATVLLTTQYLEEADQLASRIAVIDHGTVIAEGTPGQLKASAGAGTLRDQAGRPGATAAGEPDPRPAARRHRSRTGPTRSALTATSRPPAPAGRPASRRPPR